MSVELPAGWIEESYPLWNDTVVISAPGQWGGSVTISYDNRTIKSGHSLGGSTFGLISRPNQYAGRGWRNKIKSDAIAWLKEAIVPPKNLLTTHE